LKKHKVRFLVSAGEASSDMYAAGVVNHLSRLLPDLEFYGCAGPKLQAAGVAPVIDASKLAVVGLAEVVSHLPKIYAEYRKLVRFANRNRPVAALLTDSPDFHLRLAEHLKRLEIPVFYLVAPQVWAWRQNRVKTIRRLVDKLFCLFPFEEAWFRERGVNAIYIGHPLATQVRRQFSREEFFERHDLPSNERLIVLLPGSRAGEACRHMPDLLSALALLRQQFKFSAILVTPKGFETRAALQRFREPMSALAIKVIENETWDAIGHADLALAASGTVTIEAAVLGTPMVTFYKVNPLSWYAGRRLVKVPFLSMVNLVAERRIVPELIQDEMTGASIAASAAELLTQSERAERMRADLAEVKSALASQGDPLERAADVIAQAIPQHLRNAEPGCPR
jgi:lipid-A-disaccharide synthase